MRKRFFFILVFVFLFTFNSRAQYIVWDGDFMIGLSAGALMPINAPKPTLLPTDNAVDGSFKRTVSPIFAFYYGMERSVQGRFCMGFNADASFSRERAAADFLDSATITSIHQKTNVIEVAEEFFVSYYVTEKIPIQLGVGISESIIFGRAQKRDIYDLSRNLQTEGSYDYTGNFSLGGALSLQASVGVSYLITDAFFISLRLKYRYPFIDFFSAQGTGATAWLIKMPMSITPIATIGFRW